MGIGFLFGEAKCFKLYCGDDQPNAQPNEYIKKSNCIFQIGDGWYGMDCMVCEFNCNKALKINKI